MTHLVNAMEWISVKDELPEYDCGDVLVTDGVHVDLGMYFYDDNEFHAFHDPMMGKVKYWMRIKDWPKENKQ